MSLSVFNGLPTSGDYSWKRSQRGELRESVETIAHEAARALRAPRVFEGQRVHRYVETPRDGRIPATPLAVAWGWGPGTILTSKAWRRPRTVARVDSDGVWFEDSESAVERFPKDVWEVRCA